MRSVVFAGVVSFFFGLVGHIIFYPIITLWRNDRMRDLSRPGIGVLLNVLPFMVWLQAMRKQGNDDLVAPLAAYHLSFIWNAAGVITGYMMGDLLKAIKGSSGR